MKLLLIKIINIIQFKSYVVIIIGCISSEEDNIHCIYVFIFLRFVIYKILIGDYKRVISAVKNSDIKVKLRLLSRLIWFLV